MSTEPYFCVYQLMIKLHLECDKPLKIVAYYSISTDHMDEVHLTDVPLMKQVLLEINECFGSSYHTFVVLPIFRSANGDNIDDLHMSFKFVSRIKGNTIVAALLSMILEMFKSSFYGTGEVDSIL